MLFSINVLKNNLKDAIKEKETAPDSVKITIEKKIPEIEKKIREKRKAMEKAAKELDFMQAAKLRDEIKALQEKI